MNDLVLGRASLRQAFLRLWLGCAVVAALCGRQGALAGESASEELRRLVAAAWEFELREDPLFATHTGDRRYDDRLPNLTLKDHTRRLSQERKFLRELQSIDRGALLPAEQVDFDILARLKKDRIAEYEFQAYLTPITNRSGFHVEFPDLAKNVPLATVKDYENFVARLRAFQTYARQHAELMREGMRQSITLPAVVLEGFKGPLESQIVDDPESSPLFEPLKHFPESVPAADRERLADLARAAIRDSVVPGYREFLEFMSREYVPAARGDIVDSSLPRGREFYRHRVQMFTTRDMAPEEVHRIGLEEVRRIQEEMREVIRGVGFQRDFAAFVNMLRTDPRFYAETPEQLLKEVSYVLKRMDGELPRLFKTLPRAPYGIREVPAFIAPATTTAYYQPAAGDGSRAGFYYVNTYDLKSRPLFEIEALSLHEAVPGHHLQIALAQELPDLQPFRRYAGFTAFVEGWALYAERLGLEAGCYTDPYRNFGRLSYEMWRACRLVVDTGIHEMGWSRQQAIDFMAEHTALTMHNIEAEVDRYIAWPGQALAYKIGELAIRNLRKKSEQQLGQRFDVREFHDVVLSSGAVPIDVLEAQVEAYLKSKAEHAQSQ